MLAEKLPPIKTEDMLRILETLNGDLVDINVSFEEYCEKYAHDHYEWVKGMVFKVSPASLEHNELIAYVLVLLREYFAHKPLGRVISSPFVMKLEGISSREPDLMIVLNDNTDKLTSTMMNGAADICIEVISPESAERDMGLKFLEYESGGVREYWLLDPIRKNTRFHRLNEDGKYQMQRLDAAGNYQTALLEGFKLHVPSLWETPLPSPSQIVERVRAMLAD
jgi:Uma2 family endonuclease